MPKHAKKTPVKKTVRVLTKRDLVVAIASMVDITQQEVQSVVQLALDGIVDALKDGKHVEFRDFGVFEIITRRARLGRNPNKPEDTVVIPERKAIKFKPGRAMRDLCAQMKPAPAPRAARAKKQS